MHEVPIQVEPTTDENEPSPAEDVAKETQDEQESLEQELEMWRDRALRLQAEMENYRKRQRRLAEEQIAAGHERVLRALLEITENLARALAARDADAASLRQGLEITLGSAKQALDREGVHPIEAEGQPFDPMWHEAVATVPHTQVEVEPHTVVDVTEKGYRLGARVLRPARVVVAV